VETRSQRLTPVSGRYPTSVPLRYSFRSVKRRWSSNAVVSHCSGRLFLAQLDARCNVCTRSEFWERPASSTGTPNRKYEKKYD
jgi:hypothetical protein